MSYMILDSAGDAVDAFDTEAEARTALLAMVREDPTVARHLAILAFDGQGEAFGEPLTVADILPELATVACMDGEWTQRNALTFVSVQPVGGDSRPRPTITQGAAVPH